MTPKTTAAEWDAALMKASKELGLPAEVPSAVHVVLPDGHAQQMVP